MKLCVLCFKEFEPKENTLFCSLQCAFNENTVTDLSGCVFIKKDSGTISYGGKTFAVKKVAWIIKTGLIQSCYLFESNCGRKGCIKPDHLILRDSSAAQKSFDEYVFAKKCIQCNKNIAGTVARKYCSLLCAFYNKVVIKKGCWYLRDNVSYGNDYYPAYIAAWFLKTGETITRRDRELVKRYCNNKGCYNLDHLYMDQTVPQLSVIINPTTEAVQVTKEVSVREALEVLNNYFKSKVDDEQNQSSNNNVSLY